MGGRGRHGLGSMRPMQFRIFLLGAGLTTALVLLVAAIRDRPHWVVNDASTLWVVPVVIGFATIVLVARTSLPVLMVSRGMILGTMCAIAVMLYVRESFHSFSIMIQGGFVLVTVLLGVGIGALLRPRSG